MKKFIEKIGFSPKENASGLFIKKYPSCVIEVDLENLFFSYEGGLIFDGSGKTKQKITKPEDWVVFECVDRLLVKGYKPQDILLEKVYPSGHGTSGRLDILVKKENKAFLMIECKTWGKEFEKEFQKMQKDGGQLFTYFQQDRDTEQLMLYTSRLHGEEIEYKNEIVKIEESYRETSNVKDLYDRWNKFTKTNGVFEDWVNAYEFQAKSLTLEDLDDIKQEDSSFIFNRFLEILRHNVVSDKPNAFNKIFTLFLCKIKDEDKNSTDELEFQWIEGVDDYVSFQKRLTDLYRKGMKEFLSKEVTDFSDDEFNSEFGGIDEKTRKKILDHITKVRLQKNNEFAIKEVFDEETFEENGKVLKEVVELLQHYRFRYNKKQPFLGDFFELLLTTGLKQESGQFFTPVPVARFICKSVPIKEITEEKLKQGETDELLPNLIDYAAGSGHFLTESMDELQNIIEGVNVSKFSPRTQKQINSWKVDPFSWAYDYVFGVELDYRLVKTTKVGCYLNGDGIANVIHGDGLANFGSNDYKGKLKNESNDANNQKFDFVLSNPPYSVSAFKGNIKSENPQNDFELYEKLTDQSSEIECLFVERTKQLLKENGVAGIILPSSILSNAGIYTKTREIILKYFDIIAITELGSSTFMATGTNTVVLFLKRKGNHDWENINSSVQQFFVDFKDVTVNKIEKVFSKYISCIWDSVTLKDYQTLCEKAPNKAITEHEIYQEYAKKLRYKSEEDLYTQVIEIEKEKLLYFILAYKQEIVLVKTGEKNKEKEFLGYEFSNRRGSEGIHPIQRGKMIDDCTKLYDVKNSYNFERASSYILEAFTSDNQTEIHENLKENISRIDLVDTMTFDRVDFEKTISLSVKKKIKIESRWEIVPLGNVVNITNGFAFKSLEYAKSGLNLIRIKNVQQGFISNNDPVFIDLSRKEEFKKFILKEGDILVSMTGNPGRIGSIKKDHLPALQNQRVGKFNITKSSITKDYLFSILNTKYFEDSAIYLSQGLAQLNISTTQLESIKIPLPPKDIQEKIVKEIKSVEKEMAKCKKEIAGLKESILSAINSQGNQTKLEDLSVMLKRGKSPKYGTSNTQIIKSGQARGYKEFDFTEKHFVSDEFILDERKLQKGDILINSSGVGTAGRVTLFDLDGDFVVDSHISILRLNQNIALPDFVLYSLVKIGFKTIESMATGQSGQIELALKTIQNIKIDMPILTEQKKIISEIKKMELKIEKLQNIVLRGLERKDQILKKYL